MILDNSRVVFHVVAINNIFTTIFFLFYNNEINDEIGIDFSAENGRKLPVVVAKANCNVLSAIIECHTNEKTASRVATSY